MVFAVFKLVGPVIKRPWCRAAKGDEGFLGMEPPCSSDSMFAGKRVVIRYW